MAKLKNNQLKLSLLLITFLTMLAYLPLIPFLGFYSDDFFFGYVSHFYGVAGIMQSLIIDRPFNGYLLVLNYFILGLSDNVLLWHFFMFFIRLLGGYALFFLLKKIWPNRLLIDTSITLLFLIYPGFLQQVLPLGFENLITTLTLWIFSLFFTVYAIKESKRFKFISFTLIALILQINSFLQLEFFIGMEVLRLLIIVLVLKTKISFKTIKETFRFWSPYITCLLLFVLWRIFLFKSTREVTNISWVIETYYSNPFWILRIPIEIITSLLQTVILAYFFPIIINFIRIPLENTAFSLILGIISGISMYLYYKKFHHNDKKIGRDLFLIGLISILASLIPIVISGRYVRMFSVFDRYTITSIIAVSFTIVGLLFFKASNKVRQVILILLVSFSVTSHLMNGYWHKIMWDKQKDFWWQLYWRAPNIQSNTMLILDFPPVTQNTLFKDIINKVKWYRFYWAEEQIWTEGNLFFNYNNPPSDHFHGDFLADKDVVEKIKNKSVETFNNRNIVYTRDFKNSTIITTPSDTSCLKVLNGDKLIKTSLPIVPPKHIFGSEPPHNWCYFFQKASLARQFKDWDALSQLKKEVTEKGLSPKDPNEWLPFQKDLR